MKNILVAPSILSADFSCFEQEISRIEEAADLLHLDVMDGHYVPQITFGAELVKALRKKSKLFFETHLMVKNPELLLEAFIEAGSDRIVIHPESCDHLHRTLSKIKKAGVQTGLAINPSLSLSSLGLEYLAELLDSFTLMSVNPGFGGQLFIESTLRKIEELDLLLKKENLREKIQIEVDGGVNLETKDRIIRKNPDILVSGSFIFQHSNPLKAIELLKSALN